MTCLDGGPMYPSWGKRFATLRESIFEPEVNMQLALCQIDPLES
jgi:hypothetical protein